MKRSWLNHCLRLAREEGDFYSGARKIHRHKTLIFTNLAHDLSLEDAGYRSHKLTILTKHYLHQESRQSALDQWNTRLKKGKYGSVGFSCYNHLIKGHASLDRMLTSTGKVSRASIMGPCIQSICLTVNNHNETSVDIFYRTTEIFKKFPADLVLIRDVLLKDFPLPNLENITFHFANVTCHPMYFVTILPLLKSPILELSDLKVSDRYFHDWVVKWTARYVCDEYHRGIAKFAQAMRVYKDARDRIHPVELKAIQTYLRNNHVGHRNKYAEDDVSDD